MTAPPFPDLAGRRIVRVELDWALQLWTDDDWFLRLEGDLLLTTGDGGEVRHTEEAEVNDEAGPPRGALRRLEGSRIEQVVVSRQGHLVLVSGSWTLTVPPRPEFESWELHGRGEIFLCGPGGTVSYFPAACRDADGPLSS